MRGPKMDPLHDPKTHIYRGSGKGSHESGAACTRDLQPLLDKFGEGKSDVEMLIRCPCHREPCTSWYAGGGFIIMRCNRDDTVICARIKVAD